MKATDRFGDESLIPAGGVPYQPPALIIESAWSSFSGTFVPSSMRIPRHFHDLYRLYLSEQNPITIIMVLITIRWQFQSLSHRPTWAMEERPSDEFAERTQHPIRR